MIAIRPKSRQILGVNQQSYQALKAAMSLNLRRQLLIAVCDSTTLQEQLATQLEQDLAQESLTADSFDSSTGAIPSIALDRVVFDPEDAHLPRQVAQWVRQTMLSEGQLPQLQMLGIEQMTRQNATVQNQFLRSLEKVEALLPRLNTSLLIWVPWPWLRTIQSSAPTFWRWRSGVFEFVSDPTPTASVWDDSLDPDMFDDELEDSPIVEDSDQSIVDEADRPLSPDDFVSDYAEPTQSSVGLYGESGEGDRPMHLPKVEPPHLPKVEPPNVEAPKVETDLSAEPAKSNAVSANANLAKEKDERPSTPVAAFSNDQDFAQSLIADFAQSSVALPTLEPLNNDADNPVVDLVIDPLIEPVIEPLTPVSPVQPPTELDDHALISDDLISDDLTSDDLTSDDLTSDNLTSDSLLESNDLNDDDLSTAIDHNPHIDSLDLPAAEENAVEPPDQTTEPELIVDEAVLATVAPVADVDAKQQDEWNLLAAVTVAFQSNMAEAQRLTAAATKWIANSTAKPATPELIPVPINDAVPVTPSQLPAELELAEPATVEIEPVEIEPAEPEPIEVEAEPVEPEPSRAVQPVQRLEPEDILESNIVQQQTSEELSEQQIEAATEQSVPLEAPDPSVSQPTVIRLQVANVEEAATDHTPSQQAESTLPLTPFVDDADALEISDDLDFSDDLEEDLVVSEAESVGEDAPLANLVTEVLPVASLPVEAIDTLTEGVVAPATNGKAQDVSIAHVLPEEEASAVTMQRRGQQRDRHEAAADYFAIGYRYRVRIESGERDLDLIESAIAAYEGGLQCISGPHPEWASGLNDLGTLYWLKAQQLSDAQQEWDCMNHSISLYQQALTKIDAQKLPEMVCQLYSNMGAVYSILATYSDPVEHLQKAINVYCQALRKSPLSVDPIEYATLNNSLGSVYWKLSHYEEVPQNLQHAIAAYSQALRGYDPDYLPLDYASVQNNIGITYWSLAKHEASLPSLKHAMTAYYEALKYRTADVDPAACAVTYNNLALAYWDLSKNQDIEEAPRLRYQKNAITAFEAALNTAEGANTLSEVDSAAIYHCLGDVHAQMAEAVTSLQEIAQSLQKSLHSYVRAISGLTEESPIFQARLSAITANVRSHYEHLGLASQQSALNRIPPNLLSQVMVAL